MRIPSECPLPTIVGTAVNRVDYPSDPSDGGDGAVREGGGGGGPSPSDVLGLAGLRALLSSSAAAKRVGTAAKGVDSGAVHEDADDATAAARGQDCGGGGGGGASSSSEVADKAGMPPSAAVAEEFDGVVEVTEEQLAAVARGEGGRS